MEKMTNAELIAYGIKHDLSPSELMKFVDWAAGAAAVAPAPVANLGPPETIRWMEDVPVEAKAPEAARESEVRDHAPSLLDQIKHLLNDESSPVVKTGSRGLLPGKIVEALILPGGTREHKHWSDFDKVLGTRLYEQGFTVDQMSVILKRSTISINNSLRGGRINPRNYAKDEVRSRRALEFHAIERATRPEYRQ